MLRVSPLRFLSKQRLPDQPIPKHFSLIDLGTDTIKVAVIEVKNGLVKVLGHSLASARGYDVAGGRAQGAKLAGVVNTVLQEAEDATERLAGRKIVPDHALFVLPERTQAGKLFTVKQQRSNGAQPITQSEIDALWSRALRLVRQGLKALPDAGKDWIPQSVTPAGLWLDGRLVNDPVGLQGTALSLSIYGVISQPAIVRAVEKLSERLEVEVYRLVPASQALASIIPAREALVFDVGAGGADCYLIRRDALAAAGRVSMGGNFFNQAMCRVFKCDFDDAESLKVAYTSRVLSKADMSLVERSLRRPLREWAEAMTEAISAMLDSGEWSRLPCQLYFVGGSAVLPGLKDRLLYELKEKGLVFERAPVMYNLGESASSGFSHAPIGFRGILFALVLSLAKTI